MSATTTMTTNAGPSRAPQPSQKSMTKAERRELQEKQRAAKAAQKDQKQPQQPSKSQKSTQNNAQKVPPASDTRRTAGNAPASKASAASSAPARSAAPKSQSRSLRIFSHFSLPKPVPDVQGTGIHPAFIRLALQFSDFKICGANARCIATLTAFKYLIQDYQVPPANTLSRHLMTFISPQITHLVTARPMSVTMGNAIRQLKLAISQTDIDMPEQDAKDDLCQKIDDYIRDRIVYADIAINGYVKSKISDGDVILTYARSSVVEKVLLEAHKEGKKISVIVVDSRPLLEGKGLLKTLTSVSPPIPCTYTLLPALPSVITEATKVLLGAHSLHSNGSVYSRAGTAMVAMMAKQKSVPVMVCCETYKYSETVMLDGFGKNELSPSKFAVSSPKPSETLSIIDPLYDLTPASSVTVVVTEVGLIPPTSISSIPLALGKTTL